MKHAVRWFRALILILGLALPGAAVAGDIAAGDSAAIRSMIQSQIDAFQADDGATAYGFASAGIQKLYPSAGMFMQMVRDQYQPVYRPQSVIMGPIADGPSGPMQKVFLVGPDGKNYVAVYTLERQPDGTWKISGCYLVPDEAKSV